MIDHAMHDRTAFWLPLLRRLTERVPGWLVMKGIDSALTGSGDVDSVAPRETWPAIVESFRDLALAYGLGPVIVCSHYEYVLHLIALDPHRPFFFELDVNRRKVFLGSTLFYPADLLPLSEMDPRGFRRLRAGAEGLLKLVQNGAERGGLPNWAGIRRKRIVELLERDPVGMRACARLFGPGAESAIAVAEGVMRGEWNRRAMLCVEVCCVIQGLGAPTAMLARARFRVARNRCPVLQAVTRGRRQVPGSRDQWLHVVARSHTVYHRSTDRVQAV